MKGAEYDLRPIISLVVRLVTDVTHGELVSLRKQRDLFCLTACVKARAFTARLLKREAANGCGGFIFNPTFIFA